MNRSNVLPLAGVVAALLVPRAPAAQSYEAFDVAPPGTTSSGTVATGTSGSAGPATAGIGGSSPSTFELAPGIGLTPGAVGVTRALGSFGPTTSTTGLDAAGSPGSTSSAPTPSGPATCVGSGCALPGGM